MVYSFYHYPYDVREIEGKIMLNQIADCLSTKGKLNSNLFDGGNFSESFKDDFLNNCHLNLNAEKIWEKEPQYYFKIDFYNSTNLDESTFNIYNGNNNLLAGCAIQGEKEYKREVKCSEDYLFSLHGKEIYLVKILTVVKKTEKNVK